MEKKMINDEMIDQLFYNNHKLMNARLRSKKYLSDETESYILNRTRFLPDDVGIVSRLYAIKHRMIGLPICEYCAKTHHNFTRGRFTRYCGYRCSNKAISSSVAESKYNRGLTNPVNKNIDLFVREFANGKSIIQICKENGLNYKKARQILSDNGIVSPGQFDSKVSVGQKQLYEFILSICPDAIQSYKNGLEIDVYIPSKNIGIEYDGVYWHSDSIRDKNHLLKKSEYFANVGIDIIHIWDLEWLYKTEICKSIIMSRLGKYRTTLYARKCEIRDVSKKDYSDFIDANHIQGKRTSSIRIGLYYEDSLVSVMGFAKSKTEYEMTRYCSKLYTKVIGGANKLFKYAIMNCGITDVVSYSDIRLFEGEMYNTLGFDHSHNSMPNYFYFKSNNSYLHSRVAFQKHKLESKLTKYDVCKSEYQNMVDNGYHRIWDCGNRVWKYKRGARRLL
jgi:hypothetical protein